MIGDQKTFGMFNGYRVSIDDVVMSENIRDFSMCRSPSRALRRLQKRGIVGKSKFICVPKKEALVIGNTIIIHSLMYKKLLERVA